MLLVVLAFFVVVDLRLRSGVVETDATTLGLLLPVDARVAAMVSVNEL